MPDYIYLGGIGAIVGSGQEAFPGELLLEDGTDLFLEDNTNLLLEGKHRYRVVAGSYNRIQEKVQQARRTITGKADVQEGAAFLVWSMTLQFLPGDTGEYGTPADLLALYQNNGPATDMGFTDFEGVSYVVKLTAHEAINSLGPVWTGSSGAPRQISIGLEES